MQSDTNPALAEQQERSPDQSGSSRAVLTTRWLDGLPEAIGLLSAIVLPLTAGSSLQLIMLTLEQRDFLWFISALFSVIPATVVLSSAMILGFRSHPKLRLILSLAQIPTALIAYACLRSLAN